MFFSTFSILLSGLIGYSLAMAQGNEYIIILVVSGLLLTCVIGAIRHIHLSVKNKEFWYEQILDRLPTPLSVTDIDMNWTYINSPVEKLFHRPKGGFIGKQCSNWGAAICKTENCGVVRLRNGNSETFFNQFGRNFRVDTHYLYDLNKNKIGHVEVCTDITGILRAAELAEKENSQKLKLEESYISLKNTQKKLVQAEKMASLGNLVAGVAHEINTPLGICITGASTLKTRIQELSNVLASDNVSKKRIQGICLDCNTGLELINGSLERVIKLVTTFKQIAIDSAAYEQRVLDVEEHLHQFLATMRQELKDVEVDVRCPTDVYLETFPGALELAYQNFISNSLIHASMSRSKKIEFDIFRKDEKVYIEYQDSGEGIDGKILAEMFEPFNTTKRSSGNVGLGMHIVYNLITHLLKGDITCKNTPNGGAKFVIELSDFDEPSELSKRVGHFAKEQLIDTKVSFE